VSEKVRVVMDLSEASTIGAIARTFLSMHKIKKNPLSAAQV
jgi:hypothetical protein